MLKRIRQLRVDIIIFAWSLDMGRIGDIVAALPDLVSACDHIADQVLSGRQERHAAIRRRHEKRTTVANVDQLERLQAVLLELVERAHRQCFDGDVAGAFETAMQVLSCSLELLNRAEYQRRYDYRSRQRRIPPPARRYAAYLAAWGSLS